MQLVYREHPRDDRHLPAGLASHGREPQDVSLENALLRELANPPRPARWPSVFRSYAIPAYKFPVSSLFRTGSWRYREAT